MRNPTSEVVTRSHATMVSMTSPESPRGTWPARKFRLDDQTWHVARVKLATDQESWQSVMEVLAWAWLAGLIDVNAIREQLKESPDAALWHALLEK
jgi:hypothetical protein